MEEDMKATPKTRHCPICDELIPNDVSVCPYCDEVIGNSYSHRTATEQVFRTKSHYLVFTPWFYATFSLILALLLINASLDSPYDKGTVLLMWFMLLLLLLSTLIITILRIILFFTAEYTIMPDRIIICEARPFRKTTDTIDLQCVTNISLESFYAGEGLNCATVTIHTSDGKQHKLRHIKSPIDFINAIDTSLH